MGHSVEVSGRGRRWARAAWLGLTLALAVDAAAADEPRRAAEPRVLEEPGEITQVVDAFDDDNPFDLRLSLGYQQTWQRSQIRRETSINAPGLTTGGYTSDGLNVARYSQTTGRLNTRAEVGLYKDVALIVRVPIILRDERELEDLDGSADQQALILQGAPGEQLFSLPFTSPSRSGVEYLAVGLDVGIFNQYRDPTKPTWIVGVEGRFDVSEPMHACGASRRGLNLAGTSQVGCAHPSDIDRNGQSAPASFEGSFSGSREAGVSRGTTGLEAHTYLSKRIKYVEPYGGFKILFEFPNDSSDYGVTDLKGSLVNHPPADGTFLVGVNLIPWEIRDQYQRVTLDLRFAGTYRSEGRDYSELFDALGSSDAPSLRAPAFAEYHANPNPATAEEDPSVVDPSSQPVFFTGLTDVQAHGKFAFSAQFTWQAGEFIKFNMGGGYTFVQSHLITFDQACNSDFDDDLAEAGPCRRSGVDAEGNPSFTPTGIPNPNYRATINSPGRRFKVTDANQFDAWLGATVMF